MNKRIGGILLGTTMIFTSVLPSISIYAAEIPTSTNIALSKRVEVSGLEPTMEHLTGDLITDGRLDTRWSSGLMKKKVGDEGEVQTPQWVIIDLGEDESVATSMNIHYHMKVWPTKYRIETSETGEKDGEWELVKSFDRNSSDNAAVTDNISEQKTLKRYVRFYFEQLNPKAGGHAISVKEIEINGYKVEVPEVSTPIITSSAISLGTTTLTVGDKTGITMVNKLDNGDTIANESVQVEYKIMPDNGKISITNNEITALEAGTAEVTATVTYEGNTVTSNTLNITVEPKDVISRGANLRVEGALESEKEFTVTLEIGKMEEPINGLDVSLDYDSSKFEYVKVEAIEPNQKIEEVHSEETESIHVIGAVTGNGLDEATDVFRFTFRAKKTVENQSGNITTNVVIANGEGEMISLEKITKNIEISGEKELVVDINEDGKVDVGDLGIGAYYYGSEGELIEMAKKADINNDGSVDMTDLIIIAKAILGGIK